MAHQAFGRYEIRQELGRGGMATVYHAYDPSFGREVAIKVLPHEFLHDTTFRARFEREARTIATLEHPAIVPVYDFGEQDGQPFLVMRFMAGGSLAERIAQGPIPLAETARLIGQLAPALDAAHGHGVIHRDLKPSNILFDRQGNVYLSDFGIAKVAQETTALTGGGGVIGTPAYMSPEQGRGQVVDWRSDLYSLGVVVFQMLSGRLPYYADTPVGLIYAHVHDPIPDLLEANPTLPAACADLIERAMAKDTAERYQMAQEMAADLSAALGAPVAIEHTASLRTEALPPAPPYAPTVDVVEPAAMPHTEMMPLAAPAPKPSSRRLPVRAWIGVMAMIAVMVCGLALSGAFGGGAAGSEPTRQVAGSPSDTPATSPTQTPSLSSGESAQRRAEIGAARNADWTPYTEKINGVPMALVPTGCFMMGSENGESDERPVHKVCFSKPFWIDVYEVTNQAFGSVGCEDRSSDPEQPRNCVLWTEALAHCEARGVRLPTEAEWEYAARGPDGLEYPWGNEFVADNVVFGDNSGDETKTVGSKPGGMSWVGAYDLSGNLWELVSDWYSETYYDKLVSGAVNPQGPESGTSHVLRGGSWYYADPIFLRTTDRGWIEIDSVSYDIGFRCALSYQP